MDLEKLNRNPWGRGRKKKKRLEWEREPKHKRLLKTENRGAWVAQSVKRPTSAQVTISRSVGLSPTSGSGDRKSVV